MSQLVCVLYVKQLAEFSLLDTVGEERAKCPACNQEFDL